MARLDEGVCLGCGVCYTQCRFGAVTLRSRERRGYPPETLFDRVVAMAIRLLRSASLAAMVKRAKRSASDFAGLVR